MRSPELEKILEDHRLWVDTDGAEGTRLDLSGAALRSANLRCADLTRADLSIANFSSASLVNAFFHYTDFSGAYFENKA